MEAYCWVAGLDSFEYMYVNLIIWKENFFSENWLLFVGIWGEAKLFLESKGDYESLS